jgi:MFS family permease
MAGFLIGGLICLVPFVHNQTANAILLVVSISGMGLATANTWAVTQSLAPAGTVGTLSSIQNFGATFGGVIAPLLTGYIISWTKSYSIPFILAGFIMLVGIFSYTVIIRELKTISFKTS